LYEEAIRRAIGSRPEEQLVVAVVGAGRGPLVDSALRAGATRIYVVEKNLCAIVLLEHRKANEWPDGVVLVPGDMRTVELPERVDLLVSELLGGFGDNELGPECLAGCERLLAPGAISVPTSYESLLLPVMSDKLWGLANAEGKLQQMTVVNLKSTMALAAPLQVFEFKHPGQNTLYQRKRIVFPATRTGRLDGFGGWFSSELFSGVTMASRDNQGRKLSDSWETVFFPISRPMNVTEGQDIVAIFERKTNGAVVWYEWAVLEPALSPVENAGGRAFTFSLNRTPD
jgi:protein arginine N-methyltransferase 5